MSAMNATVRQPLADEFEMGSDGKIRDTMTGEIFGHVPIALRDMYDAAPDLLAACELAYRCCRVTHGASSEVCVRLENVIAKAKGVP